MKIQIEVGDISEGLKLTYNEGAGYYDDINEEKKAMYDFLRCIDNCTLTDVDMFLLYTLNNGILAHVVKDNPKIKDDSDYELITKFDPKKYRIFEVNGKGEKKSIQNESGTINHNYFNSLMGSVMADFYDSLEYLESDNINKEGRIK